MAVSPLDCMSQELLLNRRAECWEAKGKRGKKRQLRVIQNSQQNSQQNQLGRAQLGQHHQSGSNGVLVLPRASQTLTRGEQLSSPEFPLSRQHRFTLQLLPGHGPGGIQLIPPATNLSNVEFWGDEWPQVRADLSPGSSMSLLLSLEQLRVSQGNPGAEQQQNNRLLCSILINEWEISTPWIRRCSEYLCYCSPIGKKKKSAINEHIWWPSLSGSLRLDQANCQPCISFGNLLS